MWSRNVSFFARGILAIWLIVTPYLIWRGLQQLAFILFVIAGFSGSVSPGMIATQVVGLIIGVWSLWTAYYGFRVFSGKYSPNWQAFLAVFGAALAWITSTTTLAVRPTSIIAISILAIGLALLTLSRSRKDDFPVPAWLAFLVSCGLAINVTKLVLPPVFTSAFSQLVKKCPLSQPCASGELQEADLPELEKNLNKIAIESVSYQSKKAFPGVLLRIPQIKSLRLVSWNPHPSWDAPDLGPLTQLSVRTFEVCSEFQWIPPGTALKKLSLEVKFDKNKHASEFPIVIDLNRYPNLETVQFTTSIGDGHSSGGLLAGIVLPPSLKSLKNIKHVTLNWNEIPVEIPAAQPLFTALPEDRIKTLTKQEASNLAFQKQTTKAKSAQLVHLNSYPKPPYKISVQLAPDRIVEFVFNRVQNDYTFYQAANGRMQILSGQVGFGQIRIEMDNRQTFTTVKIADNVDAFIELP